MARGTIKETPFMSIRDTARSTGLSENFLRTLLKKGKLPGVPCGVSFKVNVPVLMAQLDAESVKGVSK